MSHLDILLPFSLPPAEMAADLLRQCKTPALAMLLARAKAPRSEIFDGFSRALPHETWLARQFGLAYQMSISGSPPIAWAAMQTRRLQAPPGLWYMLNPVHLHVARDHLVLTDMRQLGLSEQEARRLFDTAQFLFEEQGKTLVYGDAHTWFVRADDWQDLQTATPDAACGHNVDIWMPTGSAARAWRKLQNEVQMHWHIHEVNEERAARGDKPVNSLWLWGGTPADLPVVPPRTLQTFTLPGWTAAYGQYSQPAGPIQADAQAASAAVMIAAKPQQGLTVLDALSASALANDWAQWLHELQRLDDAWFAPLLAALQSRQIDQLSLVMSNNTVLTEFPITRRSLQRFWIKPSLNKLLP